MPATRSGSALQAAPWLLLFGRIVLFAAVQGLFAVGFFLAGSISAWGASAAWWMVGVGVANVICLAALVSLGRAEGRSYWELFRLRRESVRGDLLVLLGLLIITGPVSMWPSSLLGGWLFGDPQATLPYLLRPLPVWGVWLGIVVFPITQGLVELPLYFGYVMPRLFGQGGSRPSWLAFSLCAMMLSLQHAAAPLIFDPRYLVWRGLMFLPFAFEVGLVMRWRPRLLPYLAAVHALMDLAFALMALGPT